MAIKTDPKVNVKAVDPKINNLGQINREFQEKSTMRHAEEIKIPYVDISKTPLNPDFLKIIDIEDSRKARIISFYKSGKKLKVALEDPEKKETKAVLDLLQKQGFEVVLSLASPSGIDDSLKFYDATRKYTEVSLVDKVSKDAYKTYEKEISVLQDLPKKLESITAEQGLNLLDIGAMKTNASDIHYEPHETETVVRFRIDGVLHKVFALKNEVFAKISEQIKYQSGMKLNVLSLPQDGRYVFDFNGNKVAVRVASIPTSYGESFVCRYLPHDQKFFTFEELGFSGSTLKSLNDATKIPQGMILITGPTGSGKTTTLYSLLAVMSNPYNKVMSLEDPIEYYLPSVVQSQIDEKKGYTFASGLRSLLRHDPNIVMLGEIRDLDTAKATIQASLTGHVVLSTLHTNSAIETVPRLINMGLTPVMIAPALDTVVAQRLVRKVCPKCVTFEPILESEKAEFKGQIPEKLPRIHGCDACSNTGYLGRVVISEVIVFDPEIRALILNNANVSELSVALLKKGFVSMLDDGLGKVSQGITTLSEVLRVVKTMSF